MVTKKQNQSYVDTNVLRSMEIRLDKREDILNDFFKFLAEKDEGTLEDAREYQLKGADWKRQQDQADIEEYIASIPKMPAYEAERHRREAIKRHSTAYIDRIDSYLSSFSATPLTDENIVYIESTRRWKFTDKYKAEATAESHKTLDDTAQQAMELFIKASAVLRQADETHAIQSLLANKLWTTDDRAKIAERLAMVKRIANN